MVYLQNIPHQKVYRQRVYLPKDEKAATMYNIIFSNNKDISATLNLMKHPLLLSNHKYLNYYIEPMYYTKIGAKSVRLNYRQDRKNVYDKIDSSIKMINTPTTFDLLKNRNVYYDLFMNNSIFFKNIKATSIQKKVEIYVQYLKNLIVDKKFDSYKTKIIAMDVDSWMSNSDIINNPIMLLFIAYRKYFDIFKSIGNIDIVFYTDSLILRVNPSQCSEKTFPIFKRELNKLIKTVNIEDDDIVDKEIERQEVKDDIKDIVKDDVFHFVGDTDNDDVDETIIDDTVDEIVDDAEDKELTKKEIEKR